MRYALMAPIGLMALLILLVQPLSAMAQPQPTQTTVKTQRVYTAPGYSERRTYTSTRINIAQAPQSAHASYTTKPDSFKSRHPEATEVLLLPVRLVNGVVQAPIGAVGGMAQRTGNSVEWVNDRTFRKVVTKNGDYTQHPGKTLGRGVVMVPVGVVGTAAALPFGVAVGGLEGAFKGFNKGFSYGN